MNNLSDNALKRLSSQPHLSDLSYYTLKRKSSQPHTLPTTNYQKTFLNELHSTSNSRPQTHQEPSKPTNNPLIKINPFPSKSLVDSHTQDYNYLMQKNMDQSRAMTFRMPSRIWDDDVNLNDDGVPVFSNCSIHEKLSESNDIEGMFKNNSPIRRSVRSPD